MVIVFDHHRMQQQQIYKKRVGLTDEEVIPWGIAKAKVWFRLAFFFYTQVSIMTSRGAATFLH